MNNRLKKIRLFLFLLISFFAHNTFAEIPYEAKPLFQRAVDADKNENYKSSYILYQKALTKYIKYLNDDERDAVVERYICSADKISKQAINNSNLKECIKYTKGGMLFGVPNLSLKINQLSAFCYTNLNLQAAFCYAKLNKKNEAQKYLSEGKKYMRYVSDDSDLNNFSKAYKIIESIVGGEM